MPRFLETVTLGEVAVLIALFTAVLAFLRKAVPAVRKASRLVDDVVGAPGHPGVMDRLTAVEERLSQVSVQLHPNGGESVRDQIDKVNRKLDQLLESK